MEIERTRTRSRKKRRSSEHSNGKKKYDLDPDLDADPPKDDTNKNTKCGRINKFAATEIIGTVLRSDNNDNKNSIAKSQDLDERDAIKKKSEFVATFPVTDSSKPITVIKPKVKCNIKSTLSNDFAPASLSVSVTELIPSLKSAESEAETSNSLAKNLDTLSKSVETDKRKASLVAVQSWLDDTLESNEESSSGTISPASTEESTEESIESSADSTSDESVSECSSDEENPDLRIPTYAELKARSMTLKPDATSNNVRKQPVSSESETERHKRSLTKARTRLKIGRLSRWDKFLRFCSNGFRLEGERPAERVALGIKSKIRLMRFRPQNKVADSEFQSKPDILSDLLIDPRNSIAFQKNHANLFPDEFGKMSGSKSRFFTRKTFLMNIRINWRRLKQCFLRKKS